MRPAMTFLALVALAAPIQAERLTVTISWVEQDVYHAEHPTSEIYLFTDGCKVASSPRAERATLTLLERMCPGARLRCLPRSGWASPPMGRQPTAPTKAWPRVDCAANA